jgi:hypothetical protein
MSQIDTDVISSAIEELSAGMLSRATPAPTPERPVKCILLDKEHDHFVPVNFAAPLMTSGRCDPRESSFKVKHSIEKTVMGIVYADQHRCYKLEDEKTCYCECFVKTHKHSGL